ncbi:MAG TPA: hypothetical protein VFP80_01335 [Thermoanaerobaculia bacterium]|nr:hypothetical protein [Thermoanaerobaculia bacterium]
MSAIYAGPLCPSCSAPLEAEKLRAGTVTCPYCRTEFEATPFQPRERRHDAVQVVTETPDGVSAACANHARNAAVTSCSRCGLFICALCDMNVGDGSFCPSCYDRLRDQNAAMGSPTRYRDYATMSISAAVFSLLCSALPIGAFALYWGVKGIRQRRAEGTGIAGPVVAMIIGGLQILAFLFFIVMAVIGIATDGKS